MSRLTPFVYHKLLCSSFNYNKCSLGPSRLTILDKRSFFARHFSRNTSPGRPCSLSLHCPSIVLRKTRHPAHGLRCRSSRWSYPHSLEQPPNLRSLLYLPLPAELVSLAYSFHTQPAHLKHMIPDFLPDLFLYCFQQRQQSHLLPSTMSQDSLTLLRQSARPSMWLLVRGWHLLGAFKTLSFIESGRCGHGMRCLSGLSRNTRRRGVENVRKFCASRKLSKTYSAPSGLWTVL